MFLRRAGFFQKWLILGVSIGLAAGAGAVLFTALLELSSKFFMGTLAGASMLTPAGEGNMLLVEAPSRPWALPLVVGLGGLLSGILVFRFAPEAEGHGTDSAIAAIHTKPTGIRGRVAWVKMFASSLTIGSGGSAGREGPTAQMSAAFASALARLFDLTPRDARIAVTAGMAAGIAAIFRAPLGGAVLGAEILYLHDTENDALVPSLIASVTGFAVFGAFRGYSPIFGFLHDYSMASPWQLIPFAFLGILAGLMGRLYSFSFYGISAVSKRLRGSPIWKPAVAGVMVGLIGLAIPAALGSGYGWVQKAMGPALLTLPLWLVLALPFVKILSTSLTVGSGGSGGIFGPGMVVGGFLGAGLWRLLVPVIPDLIPHGPAPFVIVGMIACFGGISHAPLAMMLMVAEMTGTLELLAPAMLAVALSVLIVGDRTIYRSQIPDRSHAPANRFRFGLPLLTTIGVRDAMGKEPVVADLGTSAQEVLERLQEEGRTGMPVVEADGRYVGWFSSQDVEEGRLVDAYMDRSAPAVPDDATLDAVIDVFASSSEVEVPILDDDLRPVGIVDVGDAMVAYRRALGSNLRRLGGSLRGARMLEVTVEEDSPAIGQRLSDLPDSVVVVSLERGDHLVIPQSDTALKVGDVVSLVMVGGEDEVPKALFTAPGSADAEDQGD